MRFAASHFPLEPFRSSRLQLKSSPETCFDSRPSINPTYPTCFAFLSFLPPTRELCLASDSRNISSGRAPRISGQTGTIPTDVVTTTSLWCMNISVSPAPSCLALVGSRLLAPATRSFPADITCAVNSEEENKYTSIIDGILATADLTTVTRKKIRLGLEKALGGTDLSEQKVRPPPLSYITSSACGSTARVGRWALLDNPI